MSFISKFSLSKKARLIARIEHPKSRIRMSHDGVIHDVFRTIGFNNKIWLYNILSVQSIIQPLVEGFHRGHRCMD
ncbi:hypothetical protein [Chitinophaga sp. CB10]|uniref:hypothetical protein n=1 Tax=Chitinophaga sp. CB10 TaxID=1891659 RepID=UPI0025C70A97|nr:hypothetical protein [Chitinophaga sp. CB10]